MSHYLYNTSYMYDHNEISTMYTADGPSIITRTVVEHSGLLRLLTWNAGELQWEIIGLGQKTIAVCSDNTALPVTVIEIIMTLSANVFLDSSQPLTGF